MSDSADPAHDPAHDHAAGRAACDGHDHDHADHHHARHHDHHAHGRRRHDHGALLGHSHGPHGLATGAGGAAVTPAFKYAALINGAYLVGEAAAGVAFGSVALLADAAHNLSDVAGLLLAWMAAVVARRAPTRRHMFGLGRATILAALANGLIILVSAVWVMGEAALRLRHPEPVAALGVMGVAMIGIAINVGSALLFRADRHDLNARGAYVHMMADAAVSGGVVISALLVWLTGWTWLDPLAAMAVSLLVVVAAWRLLGAALHLALDGAPPGVAPEALEDRLRAIDGVVGVRDLRIWALSTTETAAAARLIAPDGLAPDAIDAAKTALTEQFGVTTAFLEVVGR